MERNNNHGTKIMINGKVSANLENESVKRETQKITLYNTNYHDASAEDIDRIVKTLSGKKIFITGASGFLGMVLLERLLRCFPEVEEICLLLRSKKGKNPQQRIKDMFNDPVFEKVKLKRGEDKILSKVRVICGDVGGLGLGLSEEDRKHIIDEISIIYHCAATVRFDEPLTTAVLFNTRGTKLMIELARNCKKLEFFGYVSTAYCHAHVKKTLEEKPYPPQMDPLKIIEACEKLNTDELDALYRKILRYYANTYVFTKSLAEQLVADTFDELPSVILRPSIVTPILEEPISGWSCNFNGPVGLLVGAGKGVIRTMYCDPKKIGDLIPVDMVINGMLITTWHYLNAKKENEQIQRVYHLTNRNSLRENWESIVEYARRAIVTRSSLGLVLWYPGGSIKTCRYHHNLCFVVQQVIPAFLIDAILYCIGIEPVLCKVQRRVCQGYEIFEYFTNNEWEFKNDNIYKISQQLNKVEQIKYVTGDYYIDCYKYLEDCTYCSRKYLLKQKDENIPSDQKLLNFMWWVDQIVTKFFIAYILYYIFNKIYSVVFNNY